VAPGFSGRVPAAHEIESLIEGCRPAEQIALAESATHSDQVLIGRGNLRLSLVTCPIEPFPATSQSDKTHFHQIIGCVSRWTKRPAAWLRAQGARVRTEGKYVEIDEEELKAIQIESTHIVDIDGFVPRADIDKRCLNKPYYITLARIVTAHREHTIMRDRSARAC
jgi:hypothetical protein